MGYKKEKLLAHFVIWGKPTILKNSKNIVMIPKKGSEKCPECGLRPTRPVALPNKKAQEYMERVKRILRQAWNYQRPITERVHINFTFFGAWKKEGGSNPDLSNLYEMPQDILQAAGVLADDRLIDNHDNSHMVHMCSLKCPHRPVYKAGMNKGKLKPDCGAVKKCPYQRLEISIYSLGDTSERDRIDESAAFVAGEF